MAYFPSTRLDRPTSLLQVVLELLELLEVLLEVVRERATEEVRGSRQIRPATSCHPTARGRRMISRRTRTQGDRIGSPARSNSVPLSSTPRASTYRPRLGRCTAP